MFETQSLIYAKKFSRCEECDYKVGMGDCLKHHKEAKHEECALDADFVFELLHLQFKINLMPTTI